MAAALDEKASDRRDHEGNHQPGENRQRLPRPHRAQQIAPVVRAVILRNQRRRVVAGRQKEREQGEIQNAARHRRGDVKR